MRVKDLGEHQLLEHLLHYCDGRVGDDGAVMGSTLAGHSLVVTTDMLIEEVHFSHRTTSAQDVGWRAAAANLSDLAAMGARPWGVVLALGLRGDTPVQWVEEVYQGFTHCLTTHGAVLVGGDTVRSEVNTLAVSAFGQVPYSKTIYRHTARPGDVILITGLHGLSKGGLEILCHPECASVLSAAEIALLHRAHQRPQPRLDIIPFLWRYTDRVAGMDTSDGLADALIQICQQSGVGAEIDWKSLPIPEILHRLAGDKALNWVLYGGEDFELVLCMPEPAAKLLGQILPSSCIIGKIVEGRGVAKISQSQGFQHF